MDARPAIPFEAGSHLVGTGTAYQRSVVTSRDASAAASTIPTVDVAPITYVIWAIEIGLVLGVVYALWRRRS